MIFFLQDHGMATMAMYNTLTPEQQKPIDDLLNFYLHREGIDSRYSKLILQELHDATEMTNDQLQQAASELLVNNSGASSTARNAANNNGFQNA
jgi:hypothetical protein